MAGARVLAEMAKIIDCVQINAISQEAAAVGLSARVADGAGAADLASAHRFRRVMADRPGGFELVTPQRRLLRLGPPPLRRDSDRRGRQAALVDATSW
ncbi:MAG: hypothetical protein R2705_07680 [Ilumatobacteraceae bacterium]